VLHALECLLLIRKIDHADSEDDGVEGCGIQIGEALTVQLQGPHVVEAVNAG
jgi:hypothetical protein